MIGYGDLYGKIYWIWNPNTDTIVRASVVRFNEGSDYKSDDDVDTKYEAVLTDTISKEEEAMVHTQKSITLIHPTGREQQVDLRPDRQDQPQTQEEQQEEENAVDWFDDHEEIQDKIVVKVPDTTTQLPTPETTLETTPEVALQPQPLLDEDQSQRLDNNDLTEIQDKAPVPPDHHLAPYTGHANENTIQPTTSTLTESMGGSTDQPNEYSTERPRRRNVRYDSDGHYAKLAKGKLPGQSFYTAHLTEPPAPIPPITLALSHIKVEHDIETSRRADFPKNYRQATRLDNFNDYWLPAMQQQDDSLIAKNVYDLIPKHPGMTVLPSK